LSLRILLDENSESKNFKNVLSKAGHDVVCLTQFLPKGTSDDQILTLARQKNRILYTQDRDFIRLSKETKQHKGIILEFVTNSPKLQKLNLRRENVAGGGFGVVVEFV